MLFTLVQAGNTHNKAVRFGLSKSFIFDGISPNENILSDYAQILPNTRAVCCSLGGDNVLITGQVQGTKGARHYPAIGGRYSSPVAAYARDIKMTELGFEVHFTSVSQSTVDSAPKYGETGYACPGTNMILFWSGDAYPGTLRANTSNQYHDLSYTRKKYVYDYEDTYRESYCYGSAVFFYGDSNSVSVRSSLSSSPSFGSSTTKPFIAFLSDIYTTATWQEYHYWQTDRPVKITGSKSQVTVGTNFVPYPSNMRDNPVYVNTSSSDENTVLPAYSEIVLTQFGVFRTLLRFHFGEGLDVEKAELVPGSTEARFVVNPKNIEHKWPKYISM